MQKKGKECEPVSPLTGGPLCRPMTLDKNIGGAFLSACLKASLAFLRAVLAVLRLFFDSLDRNTCP